MRRGILVGAVIVGFLAAIVWAGLTNFAARQAGHRGVRPGLVTGSNHPLVGDPAPAFTLLTPDGRPVALADYRGKAVMINFWATWCGPCRQETPWIAALRQQYASQGFEVLGISMDVLDQSDPARYEQSKRRVATFAGGLGIHYPVLIDGERLVKPYRGLDVVPETFYVARDGTVVASRLGMTSKEEMESNIKLALAY